MPRVALLGTGLLGSAIGRRLLECGVELKVWNRNTDRCAPLLEAGAKLLDQLDSGIQGCSAVITVLRDGPVTAEIIRDIGQLDQACVIPMGTMGIRESKELAQQVIQQQGRYLEAPVLGSKPQALNGTLLVMAGGETDAFNEQHGLLTHLCQQPIHMGPVGSGAATKLALNQLIASLTHAFSVSLRLIQQSEVDVETFMQILRSSALYAPTFDKKLQRMLDAHYSDPNFSTALLRKDLDLFLNEAITANIHAKGLNSLMELLKESKGSSLDEMDYCSLHELTRSDSSQSIKRQDP